MDEWSKDFWAMMDDVASQVERLLDDFSRDITEAVNAVTEISEVMAEQMQTAFFNEIEQYVNDLVEPVLGVCLGGLEELFDEATQPVMHTVEPLINEHPTCVGCRHYHGQSYGGQMLVCGMHPYGWDGEKCPDWQSVWMD